MDVCIIPNRKPKMFDHLQVLSAGSIYLPCLFRVGPANPAFLFKLAERSSRLSQSSAKEQAFRRAGVTRSKARSRIQGPESPGISSLHFSTRAFMGFSLPRPFESLRVRGAARAGPSYGPVPGPPISRLTSQIIHATTERSLQ